jgi:hypothetical protein
MVETTAIVFTVSVTCKPRRPNSAGFRSNCRACIRFASEVLPSGDKRVGGGHAARSHLWLESIDATLSMLKVNHDICISHNEKNLTSSLLIVP